jgi:uncharacterized coiled-coil protein SlyX
MSTLKNLMFVFDRMPDQDGCTFVEVEKESGESICAGEWRDRADGLVELVVPVNYDTPESKLDALQEELSSQTMTIQELAGANADLQQRLANAERRNAAISDLLQRVVDSSVLSFEQDAPEELESLEADICAALNHKPEPQAIDSTRTLQTTSATQINSKTAWR